MPIVSTNVSAPRACSPVVEGVGVGDCVGLGEGVGAGVDEGVGVGDELVGEGSGLCDGPDRRRRVELGLPVVTFCNDEEDCALAPAAIRTVELVGVAFCTTLHPTAAKISVIATKI